MARTSLKPRRVVLAAAIDVVAVVVFVILGRASHHEPASLGGFFVTLWPFLVALVIGWVAAQAWRHPFRVTLPGIPIWAITVVGGMMFRVASSQGVALAFIIVATVVLGVFLLGWRAVAMLVTRKPVATPESAAARRQNRANEPSQGSGAGRADGPGHGAA